MLQAHEKVAENVTAALRTEWAQSIPNLTAQLENTARRNASKAWRFEGEMHEIADTFSANDLPSEFHLAAAKTYARLSKYKDANDAPALDDVLLTMLKFDGN